MKIEYIFIKKRNVFCCNREQFISLLSSNTQIVINDNEIAVGLKKVSYSLEYKYIDNSKEDMFYLTIQNDSEDKIDVLETVDSVLRRINETYDIFQINTIVDEVSIEYAIRLYPQITRLENQLRKYVDWEVKTVMHIKNGYGYRVCLKYMDGQEKVQQKSGFKTAKEAEKARERTIAELYSGTYVVYANIKVKDFMEFWLEEDIKNRVKSYNSYDTFAYIVKNHIVPVIGKKKMTELSRGDVQKLYNTKTEYSISIARQVKTVMNISMRFGVKKKLISTSPAEGINLPKHVEKKKRGVRSIDTQKTLTMEQIKILLEKSKETPIHMQILFNVLMGLRRSEINAVKYSDVDYVNRTLTVQRQLGKVMNTKKEDFAPKTFTKQEVDLKTESSHRVLSIPDYVFEAILQEREKYEENKSRRSTKFQDLDYI